MSPPAAEQTSSTTSNCDAERSMERRRDGGSGSASSATAEWPRGCECGAPPLRLQPSRRRPRHNRSVQTSWWECSRPWPSPRSGDESR